MKAVIDSYNSDFYRCLVENGDFLSIHKSYLPADIKVGDVVNISFEKDQKATERQKELML